MSRRMSAAILAIAVALGVPLVGAPAHAAAGDQVSASFDPGDFGTVPSGTTKRLTFTLVNDGTDIVTIDPAPTASIVAPFAFVSTTILVGETIVPLATRTVTVDYTAGAVGTTPTDAITFTAVSTTDPNVKAPVTLSLQGKSGPAAPPSFTIIEPADGVVDLGTVDPGAASSVAITVLNDGALDLEFDPSGLLAVTSDGTSIPVSYGGDAVARTVRAGERGSLLVILGPMPSGAFSGALTLRGVYAEDGKVVDSAVRSLTLLGRSIAPAATPSVTIPGSGGRQLASTGGEGLLLFVGGTVAAMIILAGVALVAERRIRSRA